MTRWRCLSVSLVILGILIAGTPGLVNSTPVKKEDGLETRVRNNLYREGNTHGSLSLIPHTENVQLGASPDEIYTFDFSAEEGDKIHLRVTSTRKAHLQVLLISTDELSENHVNQSFSDFEEKISEGSSSTTKNLEAHVTIPEDDEYSLVVRHPSQSGMGSRVAGFDIIIGDGLFSSMVVRTGGYLGLFVISSSFVVVLGAGVYTYRWLKKKSTFEEGSKEWEKEVTEIQEKDLNSRSKEPSSEEEVERSSDDADYLGYDD